VLLTDIHLNATLYQEDKRSKPGNIQTTRCAVLNRGALDTKLISHCVLSVCKVSYWLPVRARSYPWS